MNTLRSFLVIFAMIGIVSCGSNKKIAGTTIYIEVEEMDPALEKCFSDNLYNKWASPEEMKTHPLSISYKGSKPEDKHIFKSYDTFDINKDTTGTVKITIRADAPGGDTTNTFFQLRKFQLEENGIWSENLNIGNFRVQDRPNDTKNPGKVDSEEICDMMIKFAIKASFK